MPTEVLSYYLKNKDRKVRLGFQVILQCAPFLKGLKVSGLISMENESYFELEEMFSGMEINFYKLSCSEGKCLVLFYRPKELEEYMNQPKLRELIGQYGYKESNIEEMDASELLGSLQIQRKVVAIVLAAATLLVLMRFAFRLAAYMEFYKDMNGYAVVEVIEIDKTETDKGVDTREER